VRDFKTPEVTTMAIRKAETTWTGTLKEGKGNMFSGVYIGNAIYNYNIAMALDREGYTNIIDFYNDAIK